MCQAASLWTHCNVHIGPATQKIAAVFLEQTYADTHAWLLFNWAEY